MNERGTSPVGPAAVVEAIATIRAGWLAILVVTIIGLIGGIVYAATSESSTRQVMRVELDAVGNNRTFSDLGVSAPVAISPGDFLRERVTFEIAGRMGVPPEELEGRLHVVGVPYSQGLITLEVDEDGDPELAREYLDTWYSVIQQDRRQQIDQLLDVAEDTVLSVDELKDKIPGSKLKKYRNDALLKLNLLKGSVRSDVKMDQKPKQVVVAKKSKVKFGLAGLLVGFVAGCGLVLVVGLVRGIARTPAGMAARFAAPVVADLGDGEGKADAEAWLASAEAPVMVDATGGTAEAGAFAAAHPDVTMAGTLGKAAPALPSGAKSCLVLTRLGSSGLSESDQLRLVIAQAPDVQRVGVVLV